MLGASRCSVRTAVRSRTYSGWSSEQRQGDEGRATGGTCVYVQLGVWLLVREMALGSFAF